MNFLIILENSIFPEDIYIGYEELKDNGKASDLNRSIFSIKNNENIILGYVRESLDINWINIKLLSEKNI